MPRTPKRERPPAEKLAPVPNEILDQFAPDRPLSAAEVEAATRRFKKALIERALGAELSHHLGIPRVARGLTPPPTTATGVVERR